MQSFVLDVSACLTWCCEDEQTPFTDQLLELAASGSSLYVPAVWPFSIVNALVQAVRRKRIPEDRAKEFPEQLKMFSFRIEPAPLLSDLGRLEELSTSHQITSYDAAYLDLALRSNLPLASLDDRLRKAAEAEGVKLAGPPNLRAS